MMTVEDLSTVIGDTEKNWHTVISENTVIIPDDCMNQMGWDFGDELIASVSDGCLHLTKKVKGK